jgi:two-component system chemotaxis response regulator CheY|uniref:Response regulator n=1 Tax=Candidatus Caldatribacterium californiense TaxID=1454726 RepID=A0A7V3YHW1_9BACT
MRVLVVDDSPLVRNMVKKACLGSAFEVVGEARNGEEAVALYRELLPDIVTLDVTMPVKDGLSAAKEILAFDPHARILLLSAMGDEELLAEARTLGIMSSLQKPFTPQALLSALQDLSRG